MSRMECEGTAGAREARRLDASFAIELYFTLSDKFAR